ncbi:MAG TPA: acetamidase/formamidase family protein [Thermomicrobiales bacterium]|jgi:acetamidase/formamidase
MPSTHRVDPAKTHCRWDNSLPPAVTIDSGDTVVFETPEITNGQVTRTATAEVLATLDFDPIHQISGPVAVRGAEPGDTLVIDVVEVRPKEWGWTAVIPGFGLLAEDAEFATPYLKIWDLSAGDRAEFKPGIVVPFEPFCGVMGVALAEPGALSTIPPRRGGGNLDIRQLTAGTSVQLPILVPGALFSCGDVHAAQGDGEVCGTGIEIESTVTLRFDLIKGQELPELTFRRPGAMTASWNTSGWQGVTAHGPDLWAATQQAIRYMIAYLGREHGLTPHEAYALCSVAVDLKISEVVDAPNWIVTAALPLGIFTG